MATLNRQLPFGEVIGVGVRLIAQGNALFDEAGRHVTLTWDDVDGERIAKIEPVDVSPALFASVNRGNAPEALSFKAMRAKPADGPPASDTLESRSWHDCGDEMLRRACALFGEKWTNRDDAIEFLSSEGKRPSDVDD